MTITKGDPATAGRARRHRPPARRSHVPNDGTAEAAAVERARKGMLHEARDLKRTRIGADVLCEALLRQGVDVFFSYPGGVILPLYDVLGDYPELRHVLVRHEQGGAHAADGYARVTGRVGVCMGTSGPGRDEPRHRHRDRPPRLRPDGRDHRQRAGRPHRQGRLPGDRHQRHHPADDQAQLPRPRRRRPAARHRRGVPHRPDRPARARSTSTSPRTPSSRRPGRSTRPRTEVVAGLPGFRPNLDGHPRQLKLAAAEIAAAKRPVILAGHGVLHAEAWDDLLAFAEKTQIPVAWTLLGIGAIDETHPLAYGYMGMHGWKHVNRAIQTRRPADRHRDALRRPGDRQRPDLRAVRPDHPRRHRPGRDRQERRGRGADRRRRQARPPGADPDGRRGRPGDPRRLLRAAGRVEDRLGRLELARLGRLARRPAVGRLRRRADRRADRPRGDLRRRRRPEPDVAGPLHRASASRTATSAPAASARWASASRRRWARRSAGRTARPGRSPATAASR